MKSASYYSGTIEHMFSTHEAGQPLPDEYLPEVAFIGRSNVGKSTLINAICGRNKLARTSNTPGATRAIHFYQVRETFRLVDLPGYGFAAMSKKQAAQVQALVGYYLENRRNLKRLFVLLDARHGIKESDVHMLQSATELGLPYSLVLTKTDKLKAAAFAAGREQLKNQLGKIVVQPNDVFEVSAEKGTGIAPLQQHLLEMCAA